MENIHSDNLLLQFYYLNDITIDIYDAIKNEIGKYLKPGTNLKEEGNFFSGNFLLTPLLIESFTDIDIIKNNLYKFVIRVDNYQTPFYYVNSKIIMITKKEISSKYFENLNSKSSLRIVGSPTSAIIENYKGNTNWFYYNYYINKDMHTFKYKKCNYVNNFCTSNMCINLPERKEDIAYIYIDGQFCYYENKDKIITLTIKFFPKSNFDIQSIPDFSEFLMTHFLTDHTYEKIEMKFSINIRNTPLLEKLCLKMFDYADPTRSFELYYSVTEEIDGIETEINFYENELYPSLDTIYILKDNIFIKNDPHNVIMNPDLFSPYATQNIPSEIRILDCFNTKKIENEKEKYTSRCYKNDSFSLNENLNTTLSMNTQSIPWIDHTINNDATETFQFHNFYAIFKL